MKSLKIIMVLILCLTNIVYSQTEIFDYRNTNGDVGTMSLAAIRGNVVGADGLAIEALTGTGYAVRTGNDTWALRSLAVGSSKLSITNADGVSGNTTFDVVEANLTLNNIGGTLGVAKGGLGVSTLTAGYLKSTGGTAAITTSATIPAADVSGVLAVGNLPSIPNSSLINSTIGFSLGSTGTDVNFGAASYALGGAVVLNVPDASLTARGVISTGTQTINGAKTFNSIATYSSGINYKQITVTATGTDALTQAVVNCNPTTTDITRTLPASPADGFTITYKRLNSSAGNTIIVPNSGQTLETGTQVKIVSQYRSITFQYEAAGTVWRILD